MKICVATVAVGFPYRFACLEGKKSKERYCQKHGYDFVYETKSQDPSRHPSWSKIKLIQKILPRYDWVFWIDADTLIMNNEIRLETLIDPQCALIICEDATRMINAGVFLIKNTPSMHELLLDTYSRKEFIYHPHWEQAALCGILFEDHPYTNMIKILQQRTMNSFSWETALPINKEYESGIYQKGDFISHLTNAKHPLKLFFLMKKYAKKLPLFTPLGILIQWAFRFCGLFHPKGEMGYSFFRTKIFETESEIK